MEEYPRFRQHFFYDIGDTFNLRAKVGGSRYD